MAKKINIWLVLILLFAAFLRFYRLPEYLQFLGDQGRDLLIVKQMIIDHKFTLLGPTASVGGFYTGPIYYYFMLPFLWAFNLNPVGPAVMSALFGLGTIVLIYFFGKEFFNEKAGLIAAFLVAISPKMVDISRFAWNPNPVPLFSLAAVLSLYFGSIRQKWRWTFLSGVMVGVLYQLHYIDLIFLPIIGIAMLLIFPWRQWLRQAALLCLGFVLGNGLFLLFELRHGFPNTKSVWEFITRGGQTISPRSNNYFWLFNDMIRRLYETVLGFRGDVLNLIYFSSLAVFAVWAIKMVRKERPKVFLLSVWLLVGVLGVGSYRGTLFDHYFNYLFPLPFLFLGLTGSWLISRKILIPLFVVFMGTIFWLGMQQWFVWTPPNNLLAQTKTVDRVVMDLVDGEDFNFALITPGNSDHAYRYFLELWGKKPKVIYNPQIDPDRKSVTGQLIVICEGPCAPLGNPAWEVAGFGRAEIVQEKVGPAGIKIFKLVHYIK